jgi:hypothetical protein
MPPVGHCGKPRPSGMISADSCLVFKRDMKGNLLR